MSLAVTEGRAANEHLSRMVRPYWLSEGAPADLPCPQCLNVRIDIL